MIYNYSKPVYFIFLLFLTSCTHLFYQPDGYLYVDKKTIEMNMVEEVIAAKTGKVIAWTFQKPKDSQKNKNVHILFFHGNAQNVSSHFYSLYWILDHGYSYTVFDYPDYGGSDGDPTQKSTTDSGIEMIQYISKKFPNSKIMIFGQSLGGNIAMYATAESLPHPMICAIAVDSTFLSYQNTAQTLLKSKWYTWALQPIAYLAISEEHSAEKNISKISQLPMQIYHSQTDNLVSFENGIEVKNAKPEKTEFINTTPNHHINSLTGPDRLKYQNKFLEFIKQNCG